MLHYYTPLHYIHMALDHCITLHYTTPHHTTRHDTTLHCSYSYNILHYATLVTYTTLHHATPHNTTLHQPQVQLQLQRCYFTLGRSRLPCTTQHYTTLHSLHHHKRNCNNTLMRLHHNYNSINYTVTTTAAFHHATSSGCG